MNRDIIKIGFYSGFAAFVAVTVFFIVQLMQIAGVFTYPWDEILIYGSSACIVIPFLIEILALHHVVSEEKKFWTHGALVFTVIYAVFVTANYVVQLVTVIPMTSSGRADEISVLVQSPHSMFWDYDAVGYICMGIATLFAIPVFEKTGFQKWIRASLIAHAAMTPIISLVYFYPNFSTALLMLASPWGITAPWFMLMIALYFKKCLTTLGRQKNI